VREFREAFPLVSLTLEEQLSLQLIEAVRNERIDVAFIRAPVADPEGLVVNPLLEEPLVVALPSSRGRARNSGGGDRSMSFKALAGETFIFYGRQPIYDATIAACHAAGFSPHVGQEADRVASALNLVAVGMGICVVPASLQRMKLDGVAYCGLTGAIQPKAVLNLISQRGDPSAVVRQFVNLVKRSTKDLPADRRKSR
jgi:DNA-binding transcriptional LysR family regulator